MISKDEFIAWIGQPECPECGLQILRTESRPLTTMNDHGGYDEITIMVCPDGHLTQIDFESHE